MISIEFYDCIEDSLLKFADIVAKYKGKWVLCKHKDRDTYECPGGHREKLETIEEAARRELWEETGAAKFLLMPICMYSAIGKDEPLECYEKVFGMIYYGEIEEFEALPDYEMQSIGLFDELPDK